MFAGSQLAERKGEEEEKEKKEKKKQGFHIIKGTDEHHSLFLINKNPFLSHIQ